uniref:MD-2-related lipid-recognition domain-containing protein n=1 Tax=Caenorhabditis japonica TaxID=281687 RepID=A0A8R1HGP7_CAEJA
MARILFILFLILPFIISASIEEIELDSKEVDEMSARFRSLRNYASHQDSTKEIQEDATKEAGSNEDNTDDPEVEAEPTAPYLLRDSSVEQEEECVALPNRTRVRPSFFQCKEDTKLELHGGAITNGNGDDAYPVSFNSSIRIFLDVTSHSNKRSNYDMCEDNPSCPITPGRQVIEFEIDPTKLFTNFFRMIHYDLVGTDHKVTVVKKSIGES